VPYGKPTHKQEQVLQKHVRGQVVTDLGAGDLDLARRLLGLGAQHVRCIDKEPKPRLKRWPANLSYDQSYFHNMKDEASFDVAFVSWPSNHETNVLPLLMKAQVVVYLGKNTDGSACGTVGIFQHFVTRELLDYSPDRENSLIILGRKLPEPRKPTGEELAGLGMTEHTWYSYREAEHYAECPYWDHEQEVKAPHGVEEEHERHLPGLYSQEG
jgi:hypothetical protein